MKKDNIFSIITMSCGLMLIISVFLPYVTYFSTSVSLWKMEDPSRFIYILLGLLVVALYLINKKTELSYLLVGYGAFTTIANLISVGGFGGLSIGFYLILLCSLAIGVMTFLYDEKAADTLINLSVSINKPVVNTVQPTVNEPVINQSQQMVNQVENLQSNIPTMKFDPMTGQPINQNNNELH